ncbi:serine/threonine protein phosphatase [Massilia eurypsychrophila]|uniref:Serine/threonine protein phosphatase n=1 Tax=Massilia eurypsychrophila TaxID=1485217 RepID=A0A2G8TIQ2_9BURK|nr:metallophosphoesterase [Massilia eurypsychrophila]PIL45921.1 serine/threonine protein phosphatase [Massilia eurypsychrophila]
MPRRALLTVATLLALLHLYIGLRLIPPMGLGAAGTSAGIALLAASALLVLTGLFSSVLKRVPFSEQLTWAGLLSMGFFSSLLVLTVLRDVALLVAVVFSAGTPAIERASAIGVPLLAFVVTLIGFVNARRVARVVDVEVPIDGLPAQFDGYSIVQISDIHVGPTIKRGYLNAIVTKVNGLKPDAIAVTGDLVDGSVKRLGMHTAPLERLAAPDGAFFVTGNHEYYSGAAEWIVEMRRLGLTVLLNEHVVVERAGQALMIAGVTDFMAHHFDESHRSDPHAAARGAPGHVKVRVLLAHQPRSAEAAADAGFHLQLSGHTHGGQFFPWNLFVPLQQPFTAGLNRLRSLWVYTSRGTGYWGPPKRFGAPSEITRVRLVRAKGV